MTPGFCIQEEDCPPCFVDLRNDITDHIPFRALLTILRVFEGRLARLRMQKRQGRTYRVPQEACTT
jgi:hypothetical protein